jgi:hypothetical protein
MIDSLAKRYPRVYFGPEDKMTSPAGSEMWQVHIGDEQKRLPIPFASQRASHYLRIGLLGLTPTIHFV